MPKTTERRDVKWLPVTKLRLDPFNPRLPEGYEKDTQKELLLALARDYDLLDVGESISVNGYFAEEPIVAMKDKLGETWTVVEGNRRLAALILLAEPEKAPATHRRAWEKLSHDRKVKVREVPCLEYATRDEIIPYLGFRHITGVLPWRPYQKARYIAQLVEDSRKTFAEIARIIGSKAPTVREQYVGYALVRQAENSFAIDATRAKESFGVLRRSLSDPAIRDFISLELNKSETGLRTPLTKAAASPVKELFLWMFGNDDTEPALKDSRRLTDLGLVLANKPALALLRTTGNLDYAFEMAGGEERRLVESLNSASYQLDQALPMAIRQKSSRDARTAFERCQQTLAEIAKIFGVAK